MPDSKRKTHPLDNPDVLYREPYIRKERVRGILCRLGFHKMVLVEIHRKTSESEQLVFVYECNKCGTLETIE